MARFNFRHGIARRQEDGYGNGANLQPSNGGSFIDLLVTPDPTIIAAAHYDTDYMITENATVSKAWGPFTGGTDYWLYWDVDFITGELSRGFTTEEPVHGLTPPNNPPVDKHWFDSNETVMKVWTGTRWIEKIRVFACKYQNGATIIDFPIESQVGITGFDVFAGAILFDPDGNPLQKFQRNRRGRFITTETELHSQFARIANFRIEASIVMGRANENIPIHYAVAYSDYDEVMLARNTNPDSPCIGIAAEDMHTGEVRSYIIRGFITNEVDWDWSDYPVGTPLFVGPTGELVPEPPISISMQQVATVINATTIYVDVQDLIDLGYSGNLTPLQIDKSTGRKYAAPGYGGGGNGVCPPPHSGAQCVFGYSHSQVTPDVTWNIQHDLGSLMVVTDVYDINGYKIIPQEIIIVDENNIQIVLEEPELGVANLVAFSAQLM